MLLYLSPQVLRFSNRFCVTDVLHLMSHLVWGGWRRVHCSDTNVHLNFDQISSYCLHESHLFYFLFNQAAKFCHSRPFHIYYIRACWKVLCWRVCGLSEELKYLLFLESFVDGWSFAHVLHSLWQILSVSSNMGLCRSCRVRFCCNAAVWVSELQPVIKLLGVESHVDRNINTVFRFELTESSSGVNTMLAFHWKLSTTSQFFVSFLLL